MGWNSCCGRVPVTSARGSQVTHPTFCPPRRLVHTHHRTEQRRHHTPAWRFRHTSSSVPYPSTAKPRASADSSATAVRRLLLRSFRLPSHAIPSYEHDDRSIARFPRRHLFLAVHSRLPSTTFSYVPVSNAHSTGYSPLRRCCATPNDLASPRLSTYHTCVPLLFPRHVQWQTCTPDPRRASEVTQGRDTLYITYG